MLGDRFGLKMALWTILMCEMYAQGWHELLLRMIIFIIDIITVIILVKTFARASSDDTFHEERMICSEGHGYRYFLRVPPTQEYATV